MTMKPLPTLKFEYSYPKLNVEKLVPYKSTDAIQIYTYPDSKGYFVYNKKWNIWDYRKSL